MTDDEFDEMREGIREAFDELRDQIDDSFEAIGQDPLFSDPDE